MKERILVTGGAGAIGANVVSSLLAKGHAVTVLDDLSSGHADAVPPGAEFVRGSVALDQDLERAFHSRPTFVIHLAALFANQNSVDHPVRDLEVNGLGTLKVLQHAHGNGVRKLVYSSSSCVYGHKEVMEETDPERELDTPYAMTKLLGEHYARFWAEQHGLDTVTLRLFNTYGPGERPGKYRNVVPNFFELAMRGAPLPITGTGEETRDFTYVGDTVAGILGALAGKTRPGEVFNIASGKSTRIIDLANAINRIAGNSAGVEYRPRRAWDAVKDRRGSIAKAQEAFGYRPSVDLETGLGLTHKWIRSHV